MALSSASNRSRSSCAGFQIGLDRGDLGLGGVHLRLGLTDVLDARAGLEQSQLGDGGGAIGAAALNLQLGVARVELRHHVAAVDAIAFRHRSSRIRPPTSAATCTSVASTWPDTRSELSGVAGAHAAASERDDDEAQTEVRARGSHESFRSMPLTEACMWRVNSSTCRGSARSLVSFERWRSRAAGRRRSGSAA